MKLDSAYLPTPATVAYSDRQPQVVRTNTVATQVQTKQPAREVDAVYLDPIQAKKTYAEISEQQNRSRLKFEKVAEQYSSHQQKALHSYISEQESLNRASMSEVIETLGVDVFV